MDKIIDTIRDKPWIVAIGVIALLLLMRMGGSRAAASPSVDYSATLASIDITSRTNVAMAQLGVERDKITMEGNAAAQQAFAAINLGAMDYAKADRQASMVEKVQQIGATNTLLTAVSNAAAAAYQSTLGQTLAAKSLDNEAYRLATDRGASYRAIDSNELIAMTDIKTQAGLTLTALDLDRFVAKGDQDIAKMSIDSAERVAGAQIGADERTRLQELHYGYLTTDRTMANLEDLYWRQKQIAKSGFLMDFLKQNVISIGNYAESTSKFW